MRFEYSVDLKRSTGNCGWIAVSIGPGQVIALPMLLIFR